MLTNIIMHIYKNAYFIMSQTVLYNRYRSYSKSLSVLVKFLFLWS